MKDNPPLKEIIGDSEGKEAALKIQEWMQKNIRYKPYYDPELPIPDFKPEVLNCYDGHNPRLEEEKRKYLAKVIKEVKKI